MTAQDASYVQSEEEIFDLMVDHSEAIKKHNIVKRERVDGLLVTTSRIEGNSFNYETIIGDAWGIYPVERYDSREDAEAGHGIWIQKSKKLLEVTCLGYNRRPPITVPLVRQQ